MSHGIPAVTDVSVAGYLPKNGTNSALQLYAVCCYYLILRCSFLNSEVLAYNASDRAFRDQRMSCRTKWIFKCRNSQQATKRPRGQENVALLSDVLCPVALPFHRLLFTVIC